MDGAKEAVSGLLPLDSEEVYIEIPAIWRILPIFENGSKYRMQSHYLSASKQGRRFERKQAQVETKQQISKEQR